MNEHERVEFFMIFLIYEYFVSVYSVCWFFHDVILSRVSLTLYGYARRSHLLMHIWALYTFPKSQFSYIKWNIFSGDLKFPFFLVLWKNKYWNQILYFHFVNFKCETMTQKQHVPAILYNIFMTLFIHSK